MSARRVALARAIVREPSLFLLDEPLSNLDAKLRASAREELEQFQKRIGTTTLYVTHDQVEAMAMGDRVAVMNLGSVRQIGTPAEVYDEPADTFVATFLGSPPMNLVETGAAIAGFRPEHFLPAGSLPPEERDLPLRFRDRPRGIPRAPSASSTASWRADRSTDAKSCLASPRLTQSASRRTPCTTSPSPTGS